MKKLFLILGLSTLLFGKMGYLQQTIKSPQNTICVYKHNGSFYGVNIGKKPYCKKSLNLKSIIKEVNPSSNDGFTSLNSNEIFFHLTLYQ